MNQPTASSDEEWLDAQSAAELLGVKRETLYAYVSRGEIRTRPVSGSRTRRYAREDLLRLKTKSAARAGHGAVAAGALSWGEPVLDTRVSAIDPERGPIYRGTSAVELAKSDASFESVAALLWNTEPLAPWRASARQKLPRRGVRPLERLALALPSLALDDPDRFVTSETVELERARRTIASMVLALAENEDRARRAGEAESIARALSIAVGANAGPASTRAVERALVVSADHELNVSTFAARVVASSGADLYACASAAIAALSGPAHGGMCDRVEALLGELDRPEHAARLVRERLARGDSLPGFGHLLYPGGDPRTPILLEGAAHLAPRSLVVRKALAVCEAVELAGAGAPSVDYGLVATAGAAGFPPGFAVAIFAIGRTAGWIAHIREQRESGALLRPRARYVGASRT